VTDLLETIGLDDIIMEATDLLGENMGETLDTIYREKMIAGTSVTRVTDDADGTYGSACATGTGAVTTVAGILNKYALDQAINILERNKAKKFTGLIQGAAKDATFPVAPAYWCIIHPDMIRDLYAKEYSNLVVGEEFTPVERYAQQTQVMEGEVGKYRCVRFVATTQSKIWADSGVTASGTPYRTSGTKVDVYSALFLGRDAYGIVPLDGLNSRSIVHRAGSAGTADALNQRSTIGWKAATTLAILNDAFMHRVECASLA
jgi:N4-gp56 family major capsid protein